MPKILKTFSKNLKACLFVAVLLMSFFSVLIDSPQTYAQTDNDPNCNPITNTCALPTPDNPRGRPSLKQTCPANMQGFPDPSGNINSYPQTSSNFFNCITRWARANNAYVPNTYESRYDPNNTGVVDFCHRNFTSSYLNDCTRGLNSNAPNARQACNRNAACLAGYAGKATQNGGGNNNNQNGGGDDASVNDIDCSGGGALGWIICPVFELGANMTQDVFDNIIRPMMEQVPVSTKGPFYAAWNNFRFLGNIVLIGAMLALVYAQARGGGR